MSERVQRRGSFPAGPALLLVILTGCGEAGTSAPGRFVPPPAVARAALDSVLCAWRDGKPRTPLTVSGRTVEVYDNERPAGRPLRSFAILGPVGTDEIRGFAVRLSYDDPPEDRTVRYVVLGEDPLWVMRQEDYERIAHWEHKMDEAKDEAAAEAGAVHHEFAAPTQPPPASLPRSLE